MADDNKDNDNENIFSPKNIKLCEEKSNKFFSVLLANKNNFNKKECKDAFEDLSQCCEASSNLPDPVDKIHPAVKLLQHWLPRLFTNDLPRERTIIADTLAYLMPKVFDPEDDDEDD
ncbi:hypothetical protein ACTFIU_011411 [Dictyostelium citrinum]